MVALRRFVARAAAAKPFASTTATSVASCSSAIPDWYAIPYQCIRYIDIVHTDRRPIFLHVQRTGFTNPIDEEMRQWSPKRKRERTLRASQVCPPGSQKA